MTESPQLENVACPVCEEAGGVVVGRSTRFGHAATNLCCATCATVYITPRRIRATLRSVYAQEQRQRCTSVALPSESGFVRAGQEGFTKVVDARAESQALNAIRLSGAQVGDRVLDIGCGDGAALKIQRELYGIDPTGLELEPQAVTDVRKNKISCLESNIDAIELGPDKFDLIQMFHLLQRVPDPLALLMQCRDALTSDGHIVMEVPNLFQPYGALEGNFFQLQNLTTFSESTLACLCHRAGLKVVHLIAGSTLYVTARVSRAAAPTPRPFCRDFLLHPECDSSWVAVRLETYAAIQHCVANIREHGPDMDLMHALVHQLGRPAFVAHLVDTVLELVDFFMGHQAQGLACLVATAASQGPHDAPLPGGFARLAAAIRESELPIPVSTTLKEATEAHADASMVDFAMSAIRDEFAIDAAVMKWPALPDQTEPNTTAQA